MCRAKAFLRMISKEIEVASLPLLLAVQQSGQTPARQYAPITSASADLKYASTLASFLHFAAGERFWLVGCIRHHVIEDAIYRLDAETCIKWGQCQGNIISNAHGQKSEACQNFDSGGILAVSRSSGVHSIIDILTVSHSVGTWQSTRSRPTTFSTHVYTSSTLYVVLP